MNLSIWHFMIADSNPRKRQTIFGMINVIRISDWYSCVLIRID